MKKRAVSFFEKLPGWLLTIVTILIILWLTLASKPLGNQPPPLFYGADKIAHALMFGFLTLMILMDAVRKRSWVRADWWILLAAVAGSAGLGIGIEYLQRAIGDGRSYEVADMVADTIGAVVAGLGWLLWEFKRKM